MLRYRWWGLVAGAAALAFALTAELSAFGLGDIRAWLPDLAVGATFYGAAWFALKRDRGSALLLAATGVAWFLGNFHIALLYVHRGPLVHLLATFRGWRPRSRIEVVVLVVGYGATLALPLWHSEWVTIALSAALVIAVGHGASVASGRERRDRSRAFAMTALLGLMMVVGAVSGLVSPSGRFAGPILLAYEVVLCVVAVVMSASLRAPSSASVADLVVELGESPSGGLRDSLAALLRDETFDVWYWSATGDLVDVHGRQMSLPPRGSSRSATFVDWESRPFAVLVHDASLLGEPALIEAVASATRLSAVNAELEAEVRIQIADLMSSRRRLLTAADQERDRLGARLKDGTEGRLRALDAMLRDGLAGEDRDHLGHLQRAREHLGSTIEDLGRLAAGLYPIALVDGLATALTDLAEQSTVPVELTVADGRFPSEVETAVYFVCAESLSNAVKHARARRVVVDVSRDEGSLVVMIVDDGIGGATHSGGSGLRGLADRIETLGGVLEIESVLGHGTRLSATLPLGPPAR